MTKHYESDVRPLIRIRSEMVAAGNESAARGIQSMIDSNLALWRARLLLHVQRMRRGKQRRRLESTLRAAHLRYQIAEAERGREVLSLDHSMRLGASE